MAAGGVPRMAMVMVVVVVVVVASVGVVATEHDSGTQAKASTQSSTSSERPHLVYVLADDLGHANVGWNNPAVMTPHLNDLRDSGVALERHFVFKYCSPTRCSLLSGRLPIHVNQENSATEQRFAGIPENMTTMSERIHEAGYRTSHIGKWHVGQATHHRHIPRGRGFDDSLSYFNFGEDHYTQRRGGAAVGAQRFESTPGSQCQGVDLWKDQAPAHGLNGTYGGYLFANEAIRVIETIDPVHDRLFMFLAWQNNHPPLQVPQDFIDRYPKGQQTTINGMSLFLDTAIHNVTDALKKQGLWNNTLLVFSGDNGAYLGNQGNSTPLRGGKFSDFDGGVRTPSFAAGGFLPEAMRGRVLSGVNAYIHIADWAHTFMKLAGIADPGSDPRAAAAGLPGFDSLDVWPLVSGENTTSPRSVVPLTVLPSSERLAEPLPAGHFRDPNYVTGGEGIIDKGFKLLLGTQRKGPFGPAQAASCDAHTGPWKENTPGVPCACGPDGCLFNLETDPTESKDLAQAMPDKVKELRAKLEALRPSVYFPDRGPLEQAACDQVQKNGGFWGPWLP